jgi:hypothetical protein
VEVAVLGMAEDDTVFIAVAAEQRSEFRARIGEG